jgi:lipoprotein-anchoring transpeptidase ErfK/SrfK
MRRFGIIIVMMVFLGTMSFAKITPAKEKESSLSIIISLKERKLNVIKNSKLEKEYPVAVPKGKIYPVPLEGKITKIVFNPSWIPTKNIRRELEKKGKKLPPIVPPGPHNPLGAAAIYLEFSGIRTIRIHGTNDEKSIGRKITYGCIRLKNSDIVKLAHFIKTHKNVKVKIVE